MLLKRWSLRWIYDTELKSLFIKKKKNLTIMLIEERGNKSCQKIYVIAILQLSQVPIPSLTLKTLHESHATEVNRTIDTGF